MDLISQIEMVPFSLDITRLDLDILSPRPMKENFYATKPTLIFIKRKTIEGEGTSKPLG